MKFDFDDILITPATISEITSRKEVNVLYGDGYLPLFTAPMDTVICEENKDFFLKAGIKVIMPRTEYSDSNLENTSFDLFRAIGMDQFEELLIKNKREGKYYILIDIANGHMTKLLDLVKKGKDMYGEDLVLMVGNVAYPETYKIFSDAGADYIRIGIGNGGGCFLEGSLVITDKGEKFIQDVVIGDLVLTHTGEYKNVSGTLQYPTREPLIKINDTISTKNHEYYVLNKIYENIVNDDNIHDYAEWVEADKLTDDYFLLEMVKNV